MHLLDLGRYIRKMEWSYTFVYKVWILHRITYTLALLVDLKVKFCALRLRTPLYFPETRAVSPTLAMQSQTTGSWSHIL